MTRTIYSLEEYQDMMSRTLEKMVHNDDIQEVFSEVLSEVRERYQAGRVAIMRTVVGQSDLQTCICEVDDHGVFATMDEMNNYFPKHRWWYDKLERGESIVINDVTILPRGEGSPRELLDRLKVRSHIGVPIVLDSESSSFLCIDIMDRPFEWTEQDERLLRDLSNMIMLWRKLHHAKKDAQHERNYLHHVLDNVPIGIALYDTDGYVTYANNRVLESMGKHAIKEIKDFCLFDSKALTPDDLKNIRERDSYDSSFNFKAEKRPGRPVSKDGKTTIYIMSRYCHLYDAKGKLKGYLAAYHDRTNEENISTRVKELDGFVSMCADFARLGFARVNVVQDLGFGTRQWFRNFHIDNDNDDHTYSETIDRMHPDDRRAVMDYRESCKTDPTATFRQRIRVQREDGTYDTLKAYSVVTHYEPERGMIETSTITINVNNQVRMEESLIEAKEAAERADKLKSAFLANMSHEIRTPLNAIIGFSQLLCTDDIPLEERPEIMNIIQNNNAILLQLINDILDLSKLESGTLDFIIKDTDVNDVCKAVASSIQMRIKPGVEIRLECPEKSCHIESDVNRLQQVLINFGSNACKFTDQGHITIGYQILDSEQIRFYVKDTGIGIAKDKLGKIFTRFVKLNEFEQGTGLGLQISEEIVKKFGGKIGVDSEEGKGSTFWCIVPRHSVATPRTTV